jgi:hypothetical protein
LLSDVAKACRDGLRFKAAHWNDATRQGVPPECDDQPTSGLRVRAPQLISGKPCQGNARWLFSVHRDRIRMQGTDAHTFLRILWHVTKRWFGGTMPRMTHPFRSKDHFDRRAKSNYFSKRGKGRFEKGGSQNGI